MLRLLCWLPAATSGYVAKVTGYRVTNRTALIRRVELFLLAYKLVFMVTGNLVTIAGRRVTRRLPLKMRWSKMPGRVRFLHVVTVCWRLLSECLQSHTPRHHWYANVRGAHGSCQCHCGSCAYGYHCNSMACKEREWGWYSVAPLTRPWRANWEIAGYDQSMAARNPFQLDRDQTERDTEYGFGAGKFPDPNIDYSGEGSISRIPVADPTRHEQELELAMIKRTDVANPNDAPSPYVLGNTDRFGAQPPLVRERRAPKYRRQRPTPPTRMQRQW